MVQLAALIYIIRTLGPLVANIIGWATLILAFIFFGILTALGVNNTVSLLLAVIAASVVVVWLLSQMFGGRGSRHEKVAPEEDNESAKPVFGEIGYSDASWHAAIAAFDRTHRPKNTVTEPTLRADRADRLPRR
jgi:hypothetical protein